MHRTPHSSFTVAGLLGLLLTGCVDAYNTNRITDPEASYSGDGFVANVPPGKYWRLIHHQRGRLTMGKLIPGVENSSDHTLVVSVETYWVDRNPHSKLLDARTGEEFLAALKRDIPAMFDASPRSTLLSLKLSPHGEPGSFCAREEVVQEEHDYSVNPEQVFTITARGFQCLDASRQFTVLASYRERKPKESVSIIDVRLAKDGEAFLKGVVVNPYRGK